MSRLGRFGTSGTHSDIYYDPFDIDIGPYPVWRRMRDEAPDWNNAERARTSTVRG